MSTPSRFSLAAVILFLAIGWRGALVDAAGPQLSASRISATNGEPFSAGNAQPVSDAGRQTVIVNPTIQPAESPVAAEKSP